MFGWANRYLDLRYKLLWIVGQAKVNHRDFLGKARDLQVMLPPVICQPLIVGRGVLMTASKTILVIS